MTTMVGTAPIASALHAAQQSCRNEIPHGRAQAMSPVTAVRAAAAEARRQPDKRSTTTAIIEQLKPTRRTARLMTTVKRRSSIAQGHGVTTTVLTQPPAEGRLRLLRTRHLHAARIAAEQVQAPTEEPEAETKSLNYLHVAKILQDLPGCYRFAEFFLGFRSELRRECVAVQPYEAGG